MKSSSQEGIGKFIELINNQFKSDSMIGSFIISMKAKIGVLLISMKNRMGVADPSRNATDTYERGKNIVPDCIKSDEGEIPVKQYNIAILRNLFKFERAEGRIQITNKRMIFRAAGRSVGGRTTLQHEYAINDIAGVETVKNYKFSIQYLIGAIFIVCFAIFFISTCSSIFSNNKPSPNNITIASYYMMSPSHIRKVYAEESQAISLRRQAEERERQARVMNRETAPERIRLARVDLENAQEKERTAQSYIQQYGENRRIDIGGRYQYIYINTTEYLNQSIREREEADRELQLSLTNKERTEVEEKSAIEQREIASAKELEAIKKRETTVTVWKVLMTLLGLILGICGAIPFFILYKKFGLKLFLLNFSIFGFALALAATDSSIFSFLRLISVLITVICIFIICFRPNLVISIKNKMGAGVGPIDIRRNEYMNKIMGLISLAIGFFPITFFWGTSISGFISNIFGSNSDGIIGSILPILLPIVLLAILLPIIILSIQRKNNEHGLDSGFAEVIPTSETEDAIREIGAIINDIQKLGDLGIEKWAS